MKQTVWGCISELFNTKKKCPIGVKQEICFLLPCNYSRVQSKAQQKQKFSARNPPSPSI